MDIFTKWHITYDFHYLTNVKYFVNYLVIYLGKFCEYA